jgi:EpsD family peptidyl-prolyl cis-trans isomerase
MILERKRMKRSIIAAALIWGVATAAVATASDILATVNGTKITREDVDAFLRQLQPNQPIRYEMLDPKMKKEVLDGIIEMELVAEAARKAGVEKDPEYRRMLDLARKKLLINAYARKQFASTVVSDSEAKEYYQKHPEKFEVPERVRVRHILLKDEKKARQVIEQLKGLRGEALKKKFIELARKESTGPSGPKGGDLGYFTKNQMVLPFSRAAFALKKGEITTEPVKTQLGWHVIYLEDRKAPQPIPFETVKAKVVAALRQERFAEKMKKETEALKKAAVITIEGETKARKSSR